MDAENYDQQTVLVAKCHLFGADRCLRILVPFQCQLRIPCSPQTYPSTDIVLVTAKHTNTTSFPSLKKDRDIHYWQLVTALLHSMPSK